MVVGEEGWPEAAVTVTPWGSDHRAVMSTFRLAPAVPPVLVSVDRRLVSAGDDLTAFVFGAGLVRGDVAIVVAGGDPGAAAVARRAPDAPPARAALTFATDGWSPGAYEAVLLDSAGAPAARIEFWVTAPGAGLELATTKAAYSLGETIEVDWRNAPGNRWDWVGVYEAGADPLIDDYLVCAYTDARVAGSVSIDAHSEGAWPLPPGDYEVHYLIDDGYLSAGHVSFGVLP